MKQLLILVCMVSFSLAVEEQLPSSDKSFSIGSSLYWFSYSEQFTSELFSTLYPEGTPPMKGKPKSDEYGLTNALHISFTNKSPLYISLSAYLSYSKIHTYDGALQGTNESEDTLLYPPFVMDEKQNRFNGITVKAGYAIPLSNKVSLTPYSGIALHRWNRALGISTGYNIANEPDTFSTFDMSEVYHWTQVPVGITLTVEHSNRYSYTLDGAINFMIRGSMEYLMNRSTFPEFDSATEVTLGNQPGVSIALGVQKRYSKLIALRVTPYYNYYHFGLSNRGEQSYNSGTTKVFFYEPESKTHSFGLNVACSFLLSEKRR